MALNATKTGKSIADLIIASDAPDDAKAIITKLWQDIIDVLYTDIKADFDIKIPVTSVIVAVSGGSGSPAVGTPNAAPIDCTKA